MNNNKNTMEIPSFDDFSLDGTYSALQKNMETMIGAFVKVVLMKKENRSLNEIRKSLNRNSQTFFLEGNIHDKVSSVSFALAFGIRFAESMNCSERDVESLNAVFIEYICSVGLADLKSTIIELSKTEEMQHTAFVSSEKMISVLEDSFRKLEEIIPNE